MASGFLFCFFRTTHHTGHHTVTRMFSIRGRHIGASAYLFSCSFLDFDFF